MKDNFIKHDGVIVKTTSLQPANSVISESSSLNDSVNLRFTKDPHLLKQYYKLREEIYRKDLGFDLYDGSENQYDRSGKILLATFNGEVVGGARLDFSNQHEFLYNEQLGSQIMYKDILKKYIPEFSEKDVYAEICALVVRRDFRNHLLITRIYDEMVHEAVKSGCKYLVGDSYSTLCRLYERLFKKQGYDTKILYDLPHRPKNDYATNSNLVAFPMFMKLKYNNNLN